MSVHEPPEHTLDSRSPYQDRSFLVTGGASGIGLATARALAHEGARVMLWDMNREALERAASEIGGEGLVVDVTDSQAVPPALERTREALTAIHGVIHCAGIMYTGTFASLPLDAQLRMVHVNLTGTIVVAHAALPHLRMTGGSLMLMGSTSSFYGPPEFAAYGASKAGVANLAEALRIEMGREGVHVGIVHPLFVDSPMMSDQNRRARLARQFGNYQPPEKVARAILRGLARRSAYVWPSWHPLVIYWLSRCFHFLAHPLMSFASRQRPGASSPPQG